MSAANMTDQELADAIAEYMKTEKDVSLFKLRKKFGTTDRRLNRMRKEGIGNIPAPMSLSEAARIGKKHSNWSNFSLRGSPRR